MARQGQRKKATKEKQGRGSESVQRDVASVAGGKNKVKGRVR